MRSPGRGASSTLWRQAEECAVALAVIAVVTFVLWVFRASFTQADISIINILAVLALSIRLGTGPTLLAAVVSFFTTNFFFIEPIFTFDVTKAQFIDLIIYLFAAVFTSQLGAYSRRQAEAASQATEEQRLLHGFSSSFNRIPDREGVFETISRVMREHLEARQVIVLPDRREAPGSNLLVVTLPLAVGAGARSYGTVRATLSSIPTPEHSRLLEACVVQAAMALERIELTEQAQRGKGFEETDRLKTALLRAVSHDLRTPITIIKTSTGNLRTLRDRLTSEERHEVLEGIENAADHLNTMVGHLLDLSRLEAGVMPINREWNVLADVAADVAARVWELNHDERIRLDFPADMPPVLCDAGLMLQALGNVVENAMRFEPPGSMVEIRGSYNDAEIRAAVIGHGSSIPAEQRDGIMEPFHRQGNGHLGLGLAISRDIVNAHHGRIWIEDTPGGGATFILALPRDSSEGPPV